MAIPACPHCGGDRLFRSSKPVSAGGGYAPNYLPGLGALWSAGKFHLLVCQDCGLTRMFASPEAREKLATSSKWEAV